MWKNEPPDPVLVHVEDERLENSELKRLAQQRRDREAGRERGIFILFSDEEGEDEPAEDGPVSRERE